MADIQTIHVATLINETTCVDFADADVVFRAIKQKLDRQEDAFVDFESITFITNAFLNVAIANLYMHFSPAFIREHVHISRLSSHGLDCLEKAIANGKRYYAQRQAEGT
jgi:hypothetical protein